MEDFATLLNRLFDTYRKTDDSEYSNREVGREIGITGSYIAQLRRGQIVNPGRDTLLGLCRFFNVEPAYFFPDIAEVPLLPYDAQRNAGLLADTIAALVNTLFTTYRKSDGSEYTNKEVAEALGWSQVYLDRIREGHIANLGRDTILGLCQFFNVEPAYFYPEIQVVPLTAYEDQLDDLLRRAGYAEEDQSLLKVLFKRLRNRV